MGGVVLGWRAPHRRWGTELGTKAAKGAKRTDLLESLWLHCQCQVSGEKIHSSLSEGLNSFLIRFWWISSVQLLSCVQLFWWIVAIFSFNNIYWAFTISILAQMAKNMPELWETQVRSLGQKDPLEEGMTTHSSILAWRIPWTEEPGELQYTGLQRGRQLND